MATLRLVFRELLHRRLNFLLSTLAIVTAVALFVSYFTTAGAARRETTRVTRDLGFNLRIIPAGTDMDQFWAVGFSDQTMPEDTIHRFAKYDKVFLTYNHLVASLQQRFMVQDKEAILTGLAPTITAPDQRKQPMGYAIKAGTVQVGFQVAQRLALKKGGALELGGKKFTVEQTLAESGTDDDIRVFGLLSDVQGVLNMKGRINEIKAIDCLCLTADQDPLKILRAELAKALPEAKVIQLRAIADARARQRQTAEKYFAFVTPLLLVVCAAWIGVLAVLNVRERKMEIGVLRALGYGSGKIAALFLAKAAVLGVIGAALGYATGSALALQFGPEIFKVTARAIKAEPVLLAWALVAAPAFAALASFIPAMLAVTQDPAVTLREE
ncbi:MAG: FtsX-like permease family protein [Verrucomicrobia bacterium]|nr:FtsX-like permease family protein [Verrucomicrobiota bacterium]